MPGEQCRYGRRQILSLQFRLGRLFRSNKVFICILPAINCNFYQYSKICSQ